MGCGTLEWADMFDHVLGLLGEEEDARVREHLASCDPCRADNGELISLAEDMVALGEITSVGGRENFADRTRDDIRSAMGGSKVRSQTSAWRVAHAAESQRLRRAAIRRRLTVAHTIRIALATVALFAAGLGLGYYALGEYLVDRYGERIERLLSVDLADWRLRPSPEKVAARLSAAAQAGAAEEGPSPELRGMAGTIERLLRREFASSSSRAEALVRLEFAVSLARGGAVADAALAAAAVRAAAGAPAEARPPGGDELLLVRTARELWRAGELARAREALLLSTLEGEPLALYLSGVIAAEEEGLDEAASKLESAAEKLPAIWAEIAWRWLAEKKPERARLALEKTPPGPVKEAVRRLGAAGR